jgi:hypothetical protein
MARPFQQGMPWDAERRRIFVYNATLRVTTKGIHDEAANAN